MNSLPQIGATRRQYRMQSLPMFLILGIGILLACLALVVGSNFFTFSGANPAPIFMPIVFLSAGLFLCAWPIRARVVIDGTRITVRSILREQSADLSEVDGFRAIQTRNGSYKRLYLKRGGGTISISNSFNFDDDARAWFRQITDLDKRDRETLLEQISNEQELGTTPEERLGKLANAKTWTVLLSVVSVAAAAALLFPQDGLHVPAAVVLAVTPAGAFLLLQRAPLLYAFFKQRSDPRAELSICLMVCSIGLQLSAVHLHFVSMPSLMIFMAPVGLVYFFGFYSACRQGPQRPGKALGLVLFAGLYACGLIMMADTLPDHAPATTYSADVLGKHISHGRSTSYYLELAPWGPMPAPNRLSVSSREYDSVNVGDEVCVSLHPGSLHQAWYQLIDCTDRFSPDLVH
jgi:hypothetical protein